MASFSRVLATSATLAFAAIFHAAAQVTPTADIAGVSAACSGPVAEEAACLLAIEAYVASLDGLSAAEIDALLGQLAAALGENSLSQGAPRGIIATALRTIAGIVSDSPQITALLGLADAIEADGDIPVASIGAPVSASPN